MFLIMVKHHVPRAEVRKLLPDHNEYMDPHFASGMYLAAGPYDTHDGGLILATGEREKIEAAVATDPFIISGIADAQIIGFSLARALPPFSGLH